LETAKAEGKLLVEDAERENQYRYIGKACLEKYWHSNINLARPLEIETRYSHVFPGRCQLVGVFDQVREVSLEFIKANRPELVVGGKLIDGYEPTVIVDCKTSYGSYDTNRFKQDPSLTERIRAQFELHENLQATTYTFLREQRTGYKPVGFFWYHLRSGKTFFTFRTERDYETLFSIIDHVLDNMEAMSYPKHVSNLCRYCDFLEPCRDDRPFLVTDPEAAPGVAQLDLIPNLKVKKDFRQPRLRLQVPREKREESFQPTAVGQGVIDLAQLPWNQPEMPEGLGFKDSEFF
jgi:hypothetical protein